MLDCILTISESTPKQWVNEARRTARVCADLCPYPVNIIETPGVPNHIGKAMAGGLAKSTAQWCCWLDDDDFLLPSAFLCLAPHFAGRPDAICAREIHLLANGRLRPMNYRHHLTAFRRDLVDTVDLTQFPATPNAALHKATPNAAHVLDWVYVHRIRRSPAMALRAQARDFERAYV